jgi:hypothetical protein
MTLLFCIASNPPWRPKSPFAYDSPHKSISVRAKDFDLYSQTLSGVSSDNLLIIHANDTGSVTPPEMIAEAVASDLPSGSARLVGPILVTTQWGRRGKYKDQTISTPVSEGVTDRRTYSVYYWDSLETLAERLAQGSSLDELDVAGILSDRSEVQQIAAQCGRLYHYWLKNQVLVRNAGHVARMYCHQSSPEARDSFERLIRPGGEFDLNLSEIRQIAQKAKQHTDACLAAATEQLINDWEQVFRSFRGAWYQQPPVDATTVQERFELVQKRARKLQELIERLSKGG